MRRRAVLAGLGLAATIGGARAQQPARMRRIAVVHASDPTAEMTEAGGNPRYRAFFKELRRLGDVEAASLAVERYSGEGRTEHYAELVGEVIRRKPDLIFANTVPLVRQFKEATATIPIVGLTSDPVASGIVASLARPGGNVTGVSVDAGLEIWGKRLEILREAAPRASRLGFLGLRATWDGGQAQVLREAAHAAGLALLGPPLDDPIQPPEYRRVIAAMVRERVDALIVGDAGQNYTYRQLIVELAATSRLPAIYPYGDHARLGGLVAYAVDLEDLFRHAAGQVDRILRGEKPGEIPYYQASTFQLIVNLKTAEALGLTIPQSLLARADEVIE